MKNWSGGWIACGSAGSGWTRCFAVGADFAAATLSSSRNGCFAPVWIPALVLALLRGCRLWRWSRAPIIPGATRSTNALL